MTHGYRRGGGGSSRRPAVCRRHMLCISALITLSTPHEYRYDETFRSQTQVRDERLAKEAPEQKHLATNKKIRYRLHPEKT
mmetsp:Transcript_26868/g.44271  ORF Transcript_26868/g.44271 Transcript_26868/m.44271 type:complete len:81 (+) Transcript_26868:268-510(+)